MLGCRVECLKTPVAQARVHLAKQFREVEQVRRPQRCATTGISFVIAGNC